MDVGEGGYVQSPPSRTCKQQMRSNYNNLYPQFLFLSVCDSMLPLDPSALLEVLEWPVGRRLGPRRSAKGRWHWLVQVMRWTHFLKPDALTEFRDFHLGKTTAL